jgi:hypothetical protein
MTLYTITRGQELPHTHFYLYISVAQSVYRIKRIEGKKYIIQTKHLIFKEYGT